MHQHQLGPHKLSQQDENEIFSNLFHQERTRAASSRSAMLDDHLPSSMLDLNNLNPITHGYPVSISDLFAGAHISRHPLYMDSDTHHSYDLEDVNVTLTRYRLDGGAGSDQQFRFEEGTLVPATVLATLVASRGCVYDENVDDPALCHARNSRAFQMDGSTSEVCPQRGFESHCPNNAAKFNNELPLHLAALRFDCICQPMLQDHCSEMSCSSVTINHDLGKWSEQSTPVENNDGPSSYYRVSQPSSAESGSNYLLAVQQILSDLSRFSLESYSSCSPSNMPSNSAKYSESAGREPRVAALSADATKTQLKILLKMVDEGYHHCLKEVHNVIAKFHPITGFDPELHAQFVLQTTSYLYESLKERISAQLRNMKAVKQSDSTTEQEEGLDSSFVHKQWALQELRRKEHQLWRPQRGLPERSVSVLRAWMFQNFLRPYPKDSEKHMLAVKSGLTRSQVSNWFINARVRIWKPMIEEMYAEINRRKTYWKGHVTDGSMRGDTSTGSPNIPT